ncbi:MAG: type II toxin-antitoxin system PemK/MazF family toxin [Dehalococcoidia bacterium]
MEQGDIYWLDRGPATGAVAAGRRPHVVVQNDLLNRSAIATVLVCPITTTMKRAVFPGNVVVEAGEGGLPQRSVVNVSQVSVADRSALGAKIGSLRADRVREIIRGITAMIEPRR